MAEPVWGGFDQAALDAAYNNRAHVPDHGRYIDRWAAESALARGAHKGWRQDLAYGPSPRQCLDYLEAGRGAPLLLFIHGGYWQALDHKTFGFIGPPWREAGIAFATMTYELCPQATLPEILGQARQALRWLQDEAGGLGFDPGRIVVAGHSAGGHMAVTLAAGEGLDAARPAAALSVSGLYELEPIRHTYLNAALRLDGPTAAALSPIRHLPRRAPPLALAVGAAELPEFVRQQRDFAAAWQAAGLAAPLAVELPGRHHFSVVDGLADPADPLFALARRLFGP